MLGFSNEYRQEDFCSVEQGLDYIFAKMGAIYGSLFLRHWEGIDANLIRQVWAEECHVMLTYRPKMDYALKNMNPDRPPSALQFAKLLNEAPKIPDKPHFHLHNQKTEKEIQEEKHRAKVAREQLHNLISKLKMPPRIIGQPDQINQNNVRNKFYNERNRNDQTVNKSIELFNQFNP